MLAALRLPRSPRNPAHDVRGLRDRRRHSRPALPKRGHVVSEKERQLGAHHAELFGIVMKPRRGLLQLHTSPPDVRPGGTTTTQQ